jgi:hypothetical protein
VSARFGLVEGWGKSTQQEKIIAVQRRVEVSKKSLPSLLLRAGTLQIALVDRFLDRCRCLVVVVMNLSLSFAIIAVCNVGNINVRCCCGYQNTLFQTRRNENPK